MQVETVLLDSMTGFEFEEFIAHLLEALGRGKVERVLFTQDEGRDILVRTLTGLLVVECKHHPNGSIGRPVVQKLHSAVISSGAESGMLVTTGHFTREAVAHAQKLTPHIEMIDRPLLTEMAARAGIRMISKGETLSIWTLNVPGENVTRAGLGEHLNDTLEGYPRKAGDLLRNVNREIKYWPIYIATYNVHAVFTTSVGTIHTENALHAKLAIDGVDGKPVEEEITDFIGTEEQSPLEGIPKEATGQPPRFRLDAVTARGKAIAAITKLHTRTISYRGRNNRRYSKVCEPGEREIFISDIRQVQLPFMDLTFKLLDTEYDASVLQGPSGKLLERGSNMMKCHVCNSEIEQVPLVCDTCGRTTHRKRFLAGRSHGFQCATCKRTTCRFDGRWSFRWLLFTKLLCPACADKQRNTGRKVYRFKPLTSPQTT